MIDALQLTPGERVLDVGTGTGAVAAAALSRGCAVVAVDPEPAMLALARLAAPEAELRQAALPDLGLAPDRFDAVTANCVLNHLSQPRASARHLRGLLVEGGRIIASIWPPSHPIQTLWTEVVADAGAIIPAGTRLPAEEDFERSEAGLAGLLAGAGLEVVKAWTHEFVHIVDPEVWWSGAAGGVATIGSIVTAQTPAMRRRLRTSFDERSSRYRGDDDLLRLPGAAVLALAVRR
jgi:SAM-dependent methyltransferase